LRSAPCRWTASDAALSDDLEQCVAGDAGAIREADADLLIQALPAVGQRRTSVLSALTAALLPIDTNTDAPSDAGRLRWDTNTTSRMGSERILWLLAIWQVGGKLVRLAVSLGPLVLLTLQRKAGTLHNTCIAS